MSSGQMTCCAAYAASQMVGVVPIHDKNCEIVSGSTCPNHRIISHDAEGLERWCDFCGKDAEGNQIKRPAGGWGTPR